MAQAERYPGFINGTGELVSRNVNATRLVNLYVSLDDTGGGKGRRWLRRRPGYRVFASGLGNGPVRTIFYQDGRCVAVVGDRFHELYADGSFVQRGTCNSDNRRATCDSNGAIGRQYFLTTGMAGYVFKLDTNQFVPVTSPGFPAAALNGAFADAYFLAAHSGYPRFSFSSLADGTTWSGIDVAQKSQTSDNLLAMIYDHKELWLFGSKWIEIWTNSGDLRNPWTPQPILIEGGIDAPDTVCKGDNGIFWMRATEHGGRIIVKADGYTPIRISTHAIEQMLRAFSRVDDAIGWYYEDEGHGFYVVTFPTEGKTLAYDVRTQVWAERMYLNPTTGLEEADLARCHAFAWGKHLVGSRVDGTIYEMTLDAFDDVGHAIHWSRRAPHVADGKRRVRYPCLELDMQVGVGLPSGQGADPKVELRYSDDGGITFGTPRIASVGKQGHRTQQVYWNKLGSSYNRVFEVSGSDPVFVGIVDAYLEAR